MHKTSIDSLSHLEVTHTHTPYTFYFRHLGSPYKECPARQPGSRKEVYPATSRKLHLCDISASCHPSRQWHWSLCFRCSPFLEAATIYPPSEAMTARVFTKDKSTDFRGNERAHACCSNCYNSQLLPTLGLRCSTVSSNTFDCL